MEYIIKDRNSLEMLKRKNIKNSIRKIKLDLEDKDTAIKYESKLNKYFFACGCQEGAIAVYATLFLCAGIWLTGKLIELNWWSIIIALAIASVGGKVFGIVLSKYKLRKTINTLHIYLRKQE